MVRVQQPPQQPAPAPPRTQYGTSSLDSDASLAAATDRRHKIIKWSATALVLSAGAALLALTVTTSTPSTATVATSTAASATASSSHDDTIQCWQSSNLNGEMKMMEPITGLEWSDSASSSSSIAFDSSQRFQTMLGFGGAFTEAAALQFARVPHDKQEQVLSLYFDAHNGSAYAMGRVPMGSSDFSLASYNFANVSDDWSLKHFDENVTHDTRVLLPFIQRALARQPDLKLFLAPWSPPAWMKRTSDIYTTPSMLGSALPNGLRPDAQATWALYFSKFITAYKAHDVPFWGLSPQNEPEFAAPWEACGSNSSFQASFIAEHLGPVLERDHPHLKLMVFDHNRASVRSWATTIYNDKKASAFVDGMAFHWYDNERYMDGVEFHERLNDTHFVDPSKFLLATESCNCPGVATGAAAWFRGQRYGHDILTDINNWVVGWVDWNLLLDHTGGPNHLGNNCDAPIILNREGDDFMIQPMYYFIQHFSKFVPPGSRRVATDVVARFDKPGDAQLFVRYPVALAACDRSARQLIHRTDDSKLQVTNTSYCIDLVRPLWVGRQLELVECQYTSQTWHFLPSGQIRMGAHCLALNNDAVHSGVRVTVAPCIEIAPDTNDTTTALAQRWHFRNHTMQSRALETADAKCVTAGYAFVQAVGFITPNDTNVLVVMNENTEDAAFDVRVATRGRDGSDGKSHDRVFATTIPQGAIRTFTW